MTKHFDPVAHRLIEAIRRALPDCDARDLYWAYHFLPGAQRLRRTPARRKTAR